MSSSNKCNKIFGQSCRENFWTPNKRDRWGQNTPFCYDIRRVKTTTLPVKKILVRFSAWNVAVESPLKRHSFFRTQKNSRNSTWNCNFLYMVLRNPVHTLTISLKPIKDMQQHTVFPSSAKYLYIIEGECHVCVTQNRKCNGLQTGSWLNYPVLGRLSFFLYILAD